MKVSDLKKLCAKLEEDGYADSDLRVLLKGAHTVCEIILTPDCYGDISLEYKVLK
jgi:hypothetical protein